MCDSGTEYKGLKIWGSPWTSQFPGINPKCCAFTIAFRQSLSDRWDFIPNDVDILITHSPPYGILDTLKEDFGASLGDMDLRERIEKIRPEMVLFGHIHENGGKYIEKEGILYINGSIVDERYRVFNTPRRVIFDEKMPKMQRFKVAK